MEGLDRCSIQNDGMARGLGVGEEKGRSWTYVSLVPVFVLVLRAVSPLKGEWHALRGSFLFKFLLK